jgi:tetratricopeptide (TPR) repeat protein
LESFAAGELSAVADSNGSFSFTSLTPGNYTVVVNAGDEYEIAREGVYIDGDIHTPGLPPIGISRPYTVMITLQLKSGSRAKAAVLNAALADVPENARKLYEKSLELERTGDTVQAIDNLRAAVSIYPKFPLALNELGVQYLKLGQAAKAVEPLKAAARLSPDAFTPKLNLGIALLETHQLPEAETQLQEALKQNPSAPTAHMYLGLTLVRLKRYDEAQKELELAISNGGDNLAPVHRFLGGLYQRANKNKEAAAELEKYLKLDPNAKDAETIKGLIDKLRKS